MTERESLERNYSSIIQCYKFPDVNSEVVKLASKVGRAFYKPEKYQKALGKLRKHMQTLGLFELKYWAHVLLISPRYSGATGQGAYIAVASRVVNEVSSEILAQRQKDWKEKYGDSLFVVE